MRNRSFITASIFLLLVSSIRLQAANLDMPRAEIRINLHSQTYVLKSWGRNFKDFPSQTLEGSLSFSIVPGEKVFIFIDDPNPFSNTYSWLVGNNSTTTNAEAVQGFADKLLGIINGLEPSPAGSAGLIGSPLGPRAPRPGGIMLAAYHQDVPPSASTEPEPSVNPPDQGKQSYRSSADILRGAAFQLQSMSATQNVTVAAGSEARAQDIIDQAVEQVQSNPAPRAGQKRVQEILSSVGIPDSEAFLQNFKGAVAKLYLLTARAQALLTDVNEGRGDAAKAAVGSWELASVDKELTSDYALIQAAGAALQSKLVGQRSLTDSKLARGFDFTKISPDTKEALANLQDLAAAKDLAIGELERQNLILDACVKQRNKESLPQCASLFESADPSSATPKDCGTDEPRPRLCETVTLLTGDSEGKVCQGQEKAKKKVSTSKAGPSVYSFFRLSCSGYAAVEIERRIELNGAKLGQLRAEKQELEGLVTATQVRRGLEQHLAQDPFFLSLIFILPRETDTREALKALQKFETTMKQVNVPIKVGEIDFADAGSVRNATLRIETLQAPDNVQLVKTDPSPGTKEYKFAFRPYSAFQLGVGGAGVFSFAKNHKFQVSPVTGGFQITDAQKNDYTGTSVAAMLTIVPSVWAQSDFHPLFEIGVGPESNIALYGGLGVQFGKVFSFGGGIVFQQIDQLAPGLSLGQVLTSPSDLKTQKHFVGGLYLHLTATATISGGKSN